MIARFRSFLVVAVLSLIPSIVLAQDIAPRDSVATEVKAAPAAGPTVDATAVAFRPAASAESEAMEMQRRQAMGKPVALMVVGGAAILVGAVIGDDPGALFMIGGAIALLYGLYQYLK